MSSVLSIKEIKSETWPVTIVTHSSSCPESLSKSLEDFERFIKKNDGGLTISEIAQAANVNNHHHPFRVALVVANEEDLLKQLQLYKEVPSPTRKQPKLCFTFPGITGRMNFGVVKTLYETSFIFRNHMDFCDTIVQKICGASIKLVLDEPGDLMSKSVDGKYIIGLAQACIVSVQYSLSRLWEHWGVKPDAVIGHCLGEIAAGVVAGTLKIEDGLEMIIKFMQRTVKTLPGAMIAVSKDSEECLRLIEDFKNSTQISEGWLEVACINFRCQTTLAGSPEVILKFKSYCMKKGYKCILIPISLAIHSKAMVPMVEDMTEIGSHFPMHPPTIPYISSVDGKVLENSELVSDHWMRCFRNKVNYIKSCETAAKMGFDAYVEIGFNESLTKLTKLNHESLAEICNDVCYVTTQNSAEKENLLKVPLKALARLYVKGVQVDWDKFHQCESKKIRNIEDYFDDCRLSI